MISPGDFVRADSPPACRSPVVRGESDKYLGWHLEPGDVALCLHVIVADEPANLPEAARRWALCLCRGRLGWFYAPVLVAVQMSPDG